MREKLYKFAIGLSICFVFDGLFMAWAIRVRDEVGGIYGYYNDVGWFYSYVILLGVFIPSVLAAMAVTGLYVHGFARRAWAPRRLEWLFFLLFALAVVVKLYIFIARPFD